MMNKLQDAHAAEAIVDTMQVNESEEKVWHRPTVSTWKIEEETVGIPSGYTRSFKNVAEAWVGRYQEAIEHLSQEVNNACCRVFFPIRFSQGHRIVELACQENTSDETFLGFGLTHWAHILRDMMI